MRKLLYIILLPPIFFGGNAWSVEQNFPQSDCRIGVIGDILQFAIPLSAFAYSAIISDWEGAKQLGYSVGATVATTEVLKYAVGEPRPYQNPDERGKSFPSGHASLSFAGAAYWQRRYGWYIGAPMYAAAAYVGYSRAEERMHDWADVIAGAAIGIGFNYLFTEKYVKPGMDLYVSPTSGGAKLNFKMVF